MLCRRGVSQYLHASLVPSLVDLSVRQNTTDEGDAPIPKGALLPIDSVVTHHQDGFRSGVARFNELLAQHLGVPLVALDGLASTTCPLLSFKVGELGPDRSLVEAYIREPRSWELFLHSYDDLPLERELVAGAQRVNCGNQEIEARVASLAKSHQTVWTPGLLLDDRRYRPAEISVFSFGMAHKIRTDMFRRLRSLLDVSGRSYVVYVSAANHETASLKDAEVVFEEMHAIFPDRLYFLGNLSDVAVSNYLRDSTFFAAFFQGGVRANNTSVASALERGSVVITNLDEFSPPELIHMETVIDIERCEQLPEDPLVLRRLGVRAMEIGRERSWEGLQTRLTG